MFSFRNLLKRNELAWLMFVVALLLLGWPHLAGTAPSGLAAHMALRYGCWAMVIVALALLGRGLEDEQDDGDV